MTRIILILLFVMFPAAAWAQVPPIEAIPPGADKIEPLKLGDPAPFTGQLFSPSTALRWGNWLKQYKYRLELDVKLAEDRCKVELTYKDRLLLAEERRAQKVEKDLEERLLRSEQARVAAEDEAANPPWYRTWTFGTIVGATVTLTSVFVIVKVVQ